MSDEKKKSISRRGFLKGAAASAGALAMAGGMVGVSQAAVPPKKWDRKTDIIVVGAGGAGACRIE
jgi:urocanate reductase